MLDNEALYIGKNQQPAHDIHEANNWFRDAVIVAFLTAFTYALAFSYEYGYCSYYQIPFSLIHLEIFDVLAAFERSLIFAVIAFLLLLGIFIVPDEINNSPLSIISLTSFVTITIIFAFSHQWSWYIWTVWILLFIISAVFNYAFITSELKFFLGLHTFHRLFAATSITNRTVELFQKLNTLLTQNPPPLKGFYFTATIITQIFLWIILFYSSGINDAMRQQDFEIIPSSPPQIVLRIYDDRIITTPFNWGSHDIHPRFSVLMLDGDSTLTMEVRRIGWLTMVPFAPIRLDSK